MSTMGGSGEGGNVHPKSESSMVVSGLDVQSESGGLFYFMDLENALFKANSLSI